MRQGRLEAPSAGQTLHFWLTWGNHCPMLPFKRGRAMPTIKTFDNCKIAIFADDHRPPHFHILGRDFKALVEIGTLAVLAGDARKARAALAWATANRDLLRAAWARYNKLR